MPNNYYEVEITADELEGFKAYLSDTENNYYSVFNKNCANATIDAWNAALFDKPELHVKGNYTGFVAEPQSLYIELGLLGLHMAQPASDILSAVLSFLIVRGILKELDQKQREADAAEQSPGGA